MHIPFGGKTAEGQTVIQIPLAINSAKAAAITVNIHYGWNSLLFALRAKQFLYRITSSVSRITIFLMTSKYIPDCLCEGFESNV